MRDFRNYKVWHLALDFVEEIYKITESFPSEERYGLSSQMRRAAVSIVSNIAEGASRSSEIDFARFIEISVGSTFELETQIIIAVRLSYVEQNRANVLIDSLKNIQKILNSLVTKIKTANG